MVEKLLLFILIPVLVIFPLEARENSSLLYKKGARLAKAGKINESIKVFKRVVALSPWFCLGHYGLGKAYLHRRGHNKEAIKHLKKATELDRTHAPSYFYLGFAYFLGNKKIHAITSFQRAYDMDESMVEALYNIASLYDMMGNTLKAHLYFRQYRVARERGEDEIF